MYKNNIGYFFREGFRNLLSHGFMSFSAIGITVACLLIMGTFSLVAVNANELLVDLEQNNEILAYVDEDFDSQQAQNLQHKLESIPDVLAVTYISRQQAMESFSAQYPEEELFQDLDPAIFRDRYSIKIEDLTELNTIVASVKQVEGIVRVNAYEEVAGGFVALRNVASAVCAALIFILGLVSAFIIGNAIRLTTQDRQEEIAIMRMVGATNGFIRMPFLVEGFLLGILSAVCAFVLQWLLYSGVSSFVGSNDTLQLFTLMPFRQVMMPVAVFFGIAGFVFGVIGSTIAVSRFMHV